MEIMLATDHPLSPDVDTAFEEENVQLQNVYGRVLSRLRRSIRRRNHPENRCKPFCCIRTTISEEKIVLHYDMLSVTSSSKDGQNAIALVAAA